MTKWTSFKMVSLNYFLGLFSKDHIGLILDSFSQLSKIKTSLTLEFAVYFEKAFDKEIRPTQAHNLTPSLEERQSRLIQMN
jgi:hypothetical protein